MIYILLYRVKLCNCITVNIVLLLPGYMYLYPTLLGQKLIRPGSAYIHKSQYFCKPISRLSDDMRRTVSYDFTVLRYFNIAVIAVKN